MTYITPKVGSVVRYYDRGLTVEAKIIEIQPFNEVFQEAKDDGLYLYLDNDMCVHEDQCRVIVA